MGWTEQHENHQQEVWGANLESVHAWPLKKTSSKEPQWVSEKRWRKLLPESQENARSSNGATAAARHQQERGLRVSFPLKLGMGLGTGGIDSTNPALRIVHIRMGSDIFCGGEDSNLVRQGKVAKKLGRKLEAAGNVVNAASVLLLSQAFCGPVVTVAMTCMAAAEFTRFAIGRLFNHLSEGSGTSDLSGWGGLPSRVQEFSSAALLLSIGVPILKRQYPAVHSTLKCMGAALPVALAYAQTAAKARRISLGAAGSAEDLWRQRHRWAARRLCGYLSDFRDPSSIGWLVDIWEETSIVLIPSVLSSRTWVIGSTPLPLRLSAKEYEEKKVDYSKITVTAKQPVNMPSTNYVLDISRNHRTDSPEQEEYGELVVSNWEETGHNLYLELSLVQSGWRRLQQRSSLILRGCYLLIIFGPLVVFGPVIYFISTFIIVAWGLQLRNVLWWLLRFCLEKGGAAFIKWGQWSATREDLFPEDLCHCLGRLHDRAPEHSYAETRKAVLKSFGRSIEDIFEDFPQKPCASGSIAQVYNAKLKDHREGMPTEVAVKVRHPSVALRIYQDFQIMGAVANWAQELPALRWLKLRESVDQFSHTLTAQADLRIEAENLSRFHQNFESLNQKVIFPKLIPDLVSEGVIVESFEKGQALHEFLRNRSALNTQIAAAGVDTYLKMLLTDNFVHTDLHPGNILARSADITSSLNQPVELLDEHNPQQKLQLVLLDFGLAEELTPTVRYHFLSFMAMVGAGNAERATYHLLQFSWPHEQTCKNPDLLVEDMKYLFSQECNLEQSPMDLNRVLIQVLQLCRKHEVTIDSAYASLVVAVCVLVGFARSLDPKLSIMDAAVPCLFLYNLTGRIMGRIYG